jgi:hypothetical protein
MTGALTALMADPMNAGRAAMLCLDIRSMGAAANAAPLETALVITLDAIVLIWMTLYWAVWFLTEEDDK